MVTGSQPTADSACRIPTAASGREFFSAIVGYELTGFPAGVHVGLPARSLTLIVPFGGATVVSGDALDGAGRPLHEPTPFAGLIGGIHDLPVHIHHDGHQTGVQVDLTPAGARALLGVRAADLAGRVISLADVLGPSARRLSDRLAEAADCRSRVAIVERHLIRLLGTGSGSLQRATQRDPATWHAWRLLSGSDGRLPVSEVAQRVGWSRRQLTARFTAEFGHPPKVAARVDAIRARPSAAAPATHPETGGRGAQVRVCRPGAPQPGVAPAGRLYPHPVARQRSVPKRSRRGRHRAVSIGGMSETISQPAIDQKDHNVWAAVSSHDPMALRAWLRGLGFVDGILVPGEDNTVNHSEMIWPEGGRVMVATYTEGGAFDVPVGTACLYVVTDHPADVCAQAKALGARFIRELEDTDYGSTGFSVRDDDGNSWSFGTYAG